MSHDLSKLFTGQGRTRPAFEFKSAKIGPFTGRPMAMAHESAEQIGQFAGRCGILRRDEKVMEKLAAQTE